MLLAARALAPPLHGIKTNWLSLQSKTRAVYEEESHSAGCPMGLPSRSRTAALIPREAHTSCLGIISPKLRCNWRAASQQEAARDVSATSWTDILFPSPDPALHAARRGSTSRARIPSSPSIGSQEGALGNCGLLRKTSPTQFAQPSLPEAARANPDDRNRDWTGRGEERALPARRVSSCCGGGGAGGVSLGSEQQSSLQSVRKATHSPSSSSVLTVFAGEEPPSSMHGLLPPSSRATRKSPACCELPRNSLLWQPQD